MAIITGTTVNWTVSPRIIVIPDTVTEITISDLQDTLQALEDDVEGIIWPHLREMSGGEDLGGGVTVGFTMELQNAQVQFEGRTTATENGTCTANDTAGTTLTAAGGQFVTNGVGRGDTVFNSSTGAMATVLSVTSETELISQPLSGGARADWQNTDGYSIYVNVQCSISGGNLVAVDGVGSSISPVLQSPNTNVVRTSSSSATISNQESLEASTFAGKYGLGIYISPSTGVDTGTPIPGNGEYPIKTESVMHTLLLQRGFHYVYVEEDLNLIGDHSVGHDFVARKQAININIGDVATYTSKDVTGCNFYDCYLTGELDSNNQIERAIIGSITNANSYIDYCALIGPIVINDNLKIQNSSIATTAPGFTCVIDFNNLAKTVIIDDWKSGHIKVKNMVPGSVLSMGGVGGDLDFDAANSGGFVIHDGMITVSTANSELMNAIVDQSNTSSTAGAVWDHSDAVLLNGMVTDIWQFDGNDPDFPVIITGDGITNSVATVNGKTKTILPGSITKT